MNFEFIRECRLESDELQAMYDNVLQELERAEHYYWRKPQECGIILRQTTERICRIYNTYYQIGYPGNASLEEFLCYTDENEHNVMVSRFLSVVRKEQRDRLNKLRVLGDDCIWGEEAPDQGMTFEDRMGQNGADRHIGMRIDAQHPVTRRIPRFHGSHTPLKRIDQNHYIHLFLLTGMQRRHFAMLTLQCLFSFLSTVL